MTVVHDRDSAVLGYDRYRARAVCLRQEHVGALLTRGWAVAAPSRASVAIFAAAFGLATAAFWATMLTSPPVTEATIVSGITSAEIERSAPRDAPMQDPGVIACMYVLTEGHRCD